MTVEPDDGRANLFAPMVDTGAATGNFGQRSQSISLYARSLGLRPICERTAVGAALLTALALVRRAGH